ncbi:hypothetical protein B0A67_07525 [Flavobacterium aquidurense]|uniref:hypothetical protein n=1 Tax=Flavobacterium aquidurense TaxID=362413 RepID=UPI00090F2BA7|nr:hypothetical protein [Flavobacterium aquidurense]OXA72382.1 hypothetical protein B0A67_07525 [Flavobacterium aquidurense]SHG42663.1 hypothetical protein SAMN05444481_104186 [Flavobacterium frigidimaris]
MPSFEKILTIILDFDFKKLNPIYQGFFVMAFFAISFCTCSYYSNDAKISKDGYRDMFNERFSGLIVKKYLDKDNKMSPSFKLKDSSNVYGYSVLWENAEIGDSLAKKANSRFVKIFKKDTLIVFDMNVAFKYHDTFPENKD